MPDPVGWKPRAPPSIQCRSQITERLAPLARMASMAERQARRSVLRSTLHLWASTTSRVGRLLSPQLCAMAHQDALRRPGRSPRRKSNVRTHALKPVPRKGRPSTNA